MYQHAQTIASTRSGDAPTPGTHSHIWSINFGDSVTM
jgi:hypothetical protein